MFPALLFRAGVAHRGWTLPRRWICLSPALALAWWACLGVLGRWLLKPDGRVFASCVQTGFRFNTYIGLAVVDRLSGHAGIASFAVLIRVMVPWVNAVSVWFLARQGGASVGASWRKNR